MEVLLNRFMSNSRLYTLVRLCSGLLALALSLALILYTFWVMAPAFFFVLSVFSSELDLSSLNWTIPDLIDGYKLIAYWLFFVFFIVSVFFVHRFLRVAFGKTFYIEKAGCRSYFVLNLLKNTTLMYFMTFAIMLIVSEYPTYAEEPGDEIVGHATIEHEGQVFEISEAFIKKSPDSQFRYRISFLEKEIVGYKQYDNIMIYLDISPFRVMGYGNYGVRTINYDGSVSSRLIDIKRSQVEVNENEDRYDMKIETNNCIGCDYVNSIYIEIPKSFMKRL